MTDTTTISPLRIILMILGLIIAAIIGAAN
jgi:hypothetical protein